MKNEKSYKDKIDPIELQNLQLSVKISNLEKQLRDSRTAIFQEPAVEPVKEPVEIKKPPADPSKNKRKLLDNLASIMANMDDPVHLSNQKEQIDTLVKNSSSTNDAPEEIKKLQMEIDQLKKQLQDKDEEYEEAVSQLGREVSEKVRGRESELLLKVEEMEDQLRRKAAQIKSTQTDDKSTTSVKVQSDESLFDIRPLKRAETQTSILESPSPNTSNVYSQTEDVEVREVVYKRNTNTQTIVEEDGIGSRFVKSQFVQTEDEDEKVVRNKEVQVDFEDDVHIKAALKKMATQTSFDDDVGGGREVLKLQRNLLNAEKEKLSQAEEIDALRRDLNEKDKKLKSLNKDFVRQGTVIEDLSSDQKSATDKYVFLMDACKHENRNLEDELNAMKEIIERKSMQDGEKVKEKEIKLAETVQRLRVTKEDLQKSENNLVSEQEEKSLLVGKQTGEIEGLKKIVAERDEEVKCLWADLNKIQKNYTNYVDASEQDCLQLEERVGALEGVVDEGSREVERLNGELSKTLERLRKKEEGWEEMVAKQKTSLLELSALKRVMSEKEEEVRMLITDLNGLQAKYATLVQEHENCEKNDSELRKGFEDCKADLRQARERNMEQSRQLEMKENKLNFIHTTSETLADNNKMNEVEIDELKNKLQKINLQNEFLSSSNEQRMRVVASTIMREKNAKINEEGLFSVQVSFLKKTIKNKDEEIKLLTDDLNSIHKRYLELLEKHPNEEEPVGNIDQRDKLVGRLRRELERKDDENTALLRNQYTLDAKYQTMFEDKDREKNNFIREKSSLQDELKQKSKNVEEKNKKLKVLSQQVDQLQNENETLAKTCSDLKVKLIQVGNALKTSALQNKELLTQCKHDQRSMSEMNEREKDLAQEKKKSDLEVASLRHKLDNATKGLKEISETQTSLKDQLARSNGELAHRQDAHNRLNQTVKNIQDKDNQLLRLREQMKELRQQNENMAEDKKEHKKTEHMFQLLRKEYDGLASHSKKQSSNMKELQTKDKLLTSQLNQKESDLKNMNAELDRCSELSRRLNILSVNR